MGRPPCCDKVGIKKGPWTPEEDIVLVSYIQEHGPGNWRAVPTNTGLMRCSKSCRLRWTNYLRPGIKRGNFTPHEEGMIIHLQALLGNKWAAIATYLPQRTDNDIKNYWNTHLKKKLKKIQAAAAALDHPQMASDSSTSNYHNFMYSKSAFTDQRGTPESSNKLSENSSVYASSAENISRLLEGWMRSSPLQATSATSNPNDAASLHCYRPQQVHDHDGTNGVPSHDDHELECFMSFGSHHHHHHHNLGNNYDKSSCDSSHKGSDESGGMMIDQAERAHFVHEDKPKVENNNPPLSYLEKWLLDESAAGCQVEGAMGLPSIF